MGPTTRFRKKLAAAAHWPGAKHAQLKMNPSGNYVDKYRPAMRLKLAA
jgi:hypothetical protein